MKIDRKNKHSERLVLTALIVDDLVLAKIANKWKSGFFRINWANLIAGWCIKYYNKYNEAPKGQIENLYQSWANNHTSKENTKLVEKFLGSISDDYEEQEEETNSQYVIDVAGKYFNEVQLEKLAEEIQGDIEIDKPEKANDRVVQFNKIELGDGEGINILQDKEAIKAAFADKKEALIEYPGDLGRFFKDALERDAFIAFLGPEKRGKTFWLLDIAYRSMLQRKKVAFFEAGDMSQNQIMRRLMIRVSGRPLYPCKLNIPVAMKIKEKENVARVKSKVKTFNKKLNWKIAKKACEKVMRTKIKSKRPLFKLSCHPNSTLNVRMMKSILQNWERDDWVPDVIVVDYADIMNMDFPGIEGRDRINETWKQLRALSQEYHCLVVTATQADASSYDAKTITMQNFSEDKRKFAHVTGMVGLNVVDAEKARDIIRLNWIVLRESRFNVQKCVHVAGCLGLSNPAIKSTF